MSLVIYTLDIKIEIHITLDVQYLVTILGQTREHFALNQHRVHVDLYRYKILALIVHVKMMLVLKLTETVKR